ncbi:MAG: thioredoxin family protein [Nitriliruptoraceae bacterium]
MPDVTLQYFDGCPNWQLADQRLTALQAELDLTIAYHRVETPEEAERVGFRGSPSLLIDGTDPFATDADPAGLACRVYDTPDGPQGAPTTDQLRRVLRGGGPV